MSTHTATESVPFKLVICCGMIRSGSTLQYQLACALLESRFKVRRAGFIAPGQTPPLEPQDRNVVSVCKLHHWDEGLAEMLRRGEAVALYSFRDLPDVAESCMRQFRVSFTRVWEQKWLHGAAEIGDRWLAEPGVYSCKYELAVNSIEDETLQISRHLRLATAPEVIRRIAAEHSVESQRTRMPQYQDNDENSYCEISLLHPHHISTPDEIESAPKLAHVDKELIEREFNDWRVARGYVAHLTMLATGDEPEATEIHVPHLGWLRHPPGDEVARLLRQGHYEADLQAFTWLYLRSGEHAVDIGAHFGLYAKLFSHQVGQSGAVVAVDPNPDSQAFLTANLTTLQNVAIFSSAISDSTGSRQLHLEAKGLASHSFIDPTGRGLRIPTLTIDELLDSLRWPVVDLLKIDTEGHEFNVLTGARASIKAGALPVIAIEFAEDNLLRTGRSTRQLADQLVEHGYTLTTFELNNLRLTPYTGPWPVWYHNLIAVKDLHAVNQRLASAPEECRRIAGDIAWRWEANKDFPALADLGRLRKQVEQLKQLETWAREADTRLRAAQEVAFANEKWARDADERLRDAQEVASANEKWARDADARFRAAQEVAAANEKWAREADARTMAARAALADAYKTQIGATQNAPPGSPRAD